MSSKRKIPSRRAATNADVILGQKIRARRIEAELSQEQLAKALGVSFQQVQKYEKGVNRVTLNRLVKIAETLGESMAYFTDTAAAPTSNLAAMLTDNTSQRLLKAFHKIEDQQTRYKVVGLLESIVAHAA